MTFSVPAEAYDRFMGRYSRLLSPLLADVGDVRAGQRAVDVGCGPGALTAELVARLGAASVSAVDPSESFVAAVRARYPGVEVERAPAEQLPFADASFDRALAQLVVHFMTDPPAGVEEMIRVTRPGGVVATCVWDHGGGRGPLSPFWDAARDLDPNVEDESKRTGANRGDLDRLLTAAGLRDVEETDLAVTVEHPSFEEWWEPFEGGVGTAGSHLASLPPEQQVALRERCRARLPEAPFTIRAHAWTARGTVDAA